MWDLLKSIKWNTTVMAVLTTIMGLALIINPDFATVTICLIVGWVLLVSGVVAVVSYFLGHRGMFGTGEVVLGVIELALGLFIVVSPGSVVQFLGILFAAILIVHGINDLRQAQAVKRYGDERWMISMGLGLLSILLGILILWNPFSSASFLMIVIGAALVYDGISDLVIVFRLGSFARKFQRGLKDDIIDMDDYDR